MGRYIIKFTKQGNIRFISHLDMLRMFKRTFRRTPVRLRYSQGYNPHPKIGFTMPLSLGFESTGDYLEIETAEQYKTGDIIRCMNECLPEGVAVKSCGALPETSKTSSAAAVEYASYTARYVSQGVCGNGAGCGNSSDGALLIREAVPGFIAMEHIISVKYSKKKQQDIETDIRPLIHSVSTAEAGCTAGGLVLSMMLRTGNSGTLNPEIFLKAISDFAGVEYREHEWRITRTDMYFTDGKNIVSMSEFRG